MNEELKQARQELALQYEKQYLKHENKTYLFSNGQTIYYYFYQNHELFLIIENNEPIITAFLKKLNKYSMNYKKAKNKNYTYILIKDANFKYTKLKAMLTYYNFINGFNFDYLKNKLKTYLRNFYFNNENYNGEEQSAI